MAHDLIPPPSPAGRPRQPSSDALELSANAARAHADPIADAAVVVEGATPPPREARLPPDSPHLPRFRFLLGALIGVGLAVVAIVALSIAGGQTIEAPKEEQWSAWRPTASDGIAAATQIADHVGPKYKGTDGKQLVAVRAGGLEIASLPLSIALRSAAPGGKIELFEGPGVIYTLNGLGERGSIRSGKPSEARHLFLRREALELALYTFKYIDDVENVVVLLPPRKTDTEATGKPSASGTPAAAAAPSGTATGATGECGVTQTQAVFFRPSDLRESLDIPLGFTVPDETPTATVLAKGPEALKIEAMTHPRLYLASFTQSQDARAFLVLDSLPQ